MRTIYDSSKRNLNLTNGIEKLTRWRLRPTKFDFEVVHRAGVNYQTGHALFHLETTGGDDTQLEDKLLPLAINTKSDNNSILAINASSDDSILLYAQKKNPFDTPPTLEEQTVEQVIDEHSQAAYFNVDHAGPDYHIDQRGLFA